MTKPKLCLPCGKHHGGLLLVSDRSDPSAVAAQLVVETCPACQKQLAAGYTAFHCKSLHQTLWLKPGSGLVEHMVGKVIIINPQQFNRLKGEYPQNGSIS